MQVLLNVAGAGWNAPAVGLVDLTTAAARQWLEWRATLAPMLALTKFYAASVYDCSLDPLLATEVADDLPEQCIDGMIVMPDDFEPTRAEEGFRADAMTIRLKDTGVMWHFYEKHGDGAFESDEIPWEAIEAVAQGRPYVRL
jgi:hypothetical protein